MSDRLYQSGIIVLIIILYFFLVFETYLKDFNNFFYQWFYLILVHILLFMIIWSYIATIFTEPGLPPEFWVIHHLLPFLYFCSFNSKRVSIWMNLKFEKKDIA